MGEGVAKLVRVQVGKAGLGTPAAKDLPDAVRAVRATLAEPQPGQAGPAGVQQGPAATGQERLGLAEDPLVQTAVSPGRARPSGPKSSVLFR